MPEKTKPTAPKSRAARPLETAKKLALHVHDGKVIQIHDGEQETPLGVIMSPRGVNLRDVAKLIGTAINAPVSHFDAAGKETE